jgi:uncharacterized membrane protein
MDPHLVEWLNLALRWAHVITGIAWIGSSFYFMWLDAHLTKPEPQRQNVDGEISTLPRNVSWRPARFLKTCSGSNGRRRTP